MLLAGMLAALPLTSLLNVGTAHAESIAGETFTGISTQANQWISGGGTEPACLTAASSSAANSIPACTGGAVNTAGNGVLRLTRNSNNQNGFAIYNTPVSAGEGLDIQFDMYQYGGTGADGIAFFLVDGSANPTQPGAMGGSLGYSGTPETDPGIVGGYVGVGFDRWGNFSDPGFGNGGPGRYPNSITVRGNEASGYQFVSRKSASGALGVEAGGTRANSKRHVRVAISTNNIMTVAVNYFNGQGMKTELSNLNLNTINGEGSLPENFKFGFAASTGGSNNIHEIGGLTVDTLNPDVSPVSPNASGVRGEQASYTINVKNDAGAEATTGEISVTDTLPSELKPTAAQGDGWDCTVSGQTVTCTRPGDGDNVLAAGASTPNITVDVNVSEEAVSLASYNHTIQVTTPGNTGTAPQLTGVFTISGPGDLDGIYKPVEDAAPNSGDVNDDGIVDGDQTFITSFVNPLTNKYAAVESGGDCDQNSEVGIVAESSNTKADDGYSYPAGIMKFNLECAAAGDSTTVTQYYFGDYDPASMVLRKYNSVTHTYQTVSGATFSKATIGGQQAIKVSYAITDGGPLDEDGQANGVIVDPAGPALKDAVVTAPTAASAPDTGLPQQAMAVYYVAGLSGMMMLAYGIYKFRYQR